MYPTVHTMSNTFPHIRILAIETSCDDTGIAVIAAEPRAKNLEPRENQNGARTVRVLANELSSQVVHAQYGGVFPTVAKREHALMLVPLLERAVRNTRQQTTDSLALLADRRQTHPGMNEHEDANMPTKLTDEQKRYLATLLAREPELLAAMVPFFETYARPDIDAIAVTRGPGLEPCLWVGINCAKALSYVWGVPVVGVNHMEGHIYAALAQDDRPLRLQTASLTDNRLVPEQLSLSLMSDVCPLLSLLISGGHTEFVLSTTTGQYEVIGQTRDDAVGECFDKTARMLGLAYPGGPKIGLLSAEARAEGLPRTVVLPRPMKDSGDLDFSFSGLKTAVKVALEKLLHRGQTSAETQKVFAREIEDAIVDVLVVKTRAALERTQAATLVVSGGVSASTRIRAELEALIASEFPGVTLLFSPKHLATDNALMIALASIAHVENGEFVSTDALVADGNVRLGSAL